MSRCPLTPDVVGFDYGEMPAVEITVLRTQAERIRKAHRSLTSTMLQIGRELIDIEARLPHAQFERWVEAECGLNYMRAAEFAEGKSAMISGLQPGVIYRLASPSTPPALVNNVLDRVSKGEVITTYAVEVELAEIRREKRKRPNLNAVLKQISKIAQARLDGVLGTAGGLLHNLETSKPETVALIVQEMADREETRKEVRALRDWLNRLLAMSRAQREKAKVEAAG